MRLLIDYAVFTLIILASFAFTFYKNVSSPAEKTKSDYVFASRGSVATWPMLISIARGFLGVRVFLGYPSELFYKGCELWETLYGILLAFPLVMYFFIPVYFSLGITSVYQYLDMRFKSKLVRRIASATYVVRTLLLLGVATFTPCIAIKTVIGIPYYVSITVMIVVSIVFMFSGGFSSALMGDVVQGVLMLLVCCFVIVKGTIEAGGPWNVITLSRERGRLNFFNFDLDPTKRATTISALLGHLFISLSMYGCQQNYVQRYASLRSQEKVNRILLLSIPVTTVMMSLSWIVGMVILADFVDCDPLKLEYMQNIDELFPFYLENKFSAYPGALGIVLGILFNGALSAIVSNVNCVATVLWEDFVSNAHQFKKLSDKKQVWALKILCAISCLLVMGVTFFVSQFSGIIQISIIMISATSGPLLGIFTLAMFFPSVNWKGAVIGTLGGFLLIMWLIVGAELSPTTPTVYLPTSTNHCTNETFNPEVIQRRKSLIAETFKTPAIVNRSSIVQPPDENVLQSFYKITYLYYSVIGTLATVLIGVLTCSLMGSQAEEYLFSENLVHPLVNKLRPHHTRIPMEIN